MADSFWSDDRTMELCDYIAEGMSFGEVAQRMKVAKGAAFNKFRRIREKYGKQGE